MKLTAYALILTIGLAAAHVEVEPALYPEIYPSLDEAALASIAHAYDFSNQYEYGGMILETKEHTFRIGLPETSWRGDGLHIDYTNDWGIYTVVADYHTHPCMPFSHFPGVLSTADVNSNIRVNLVGIMGDLCTGEVHKFTPDVDTLDMTWADGDQGSHGEVIGIVLLWRVGSPVVEDYPGPLAMHEW